MSNEVSAHVDVQNGALQESGPVPSRDERFEAQSALPVAIVATFTAEPLCKPLEFWMARLEIAADVAIAPYGQVLQELLNPQSLFSGNKRGFNVLLLRMEDWIRDRLEQGMESNVAHCRSVANDVLSAVKVLQSRTKSSLLVFVCPGASSLVADYAKPLDEIGRDLVARMGRIANVQCWAHTDVVRLYPVTAHEDLTADRIGHIPYTNEYFAAMATLAARRIAAAVKPQCKVIAVDCDNTLWKGVCGEDGPAGLALTPAHLEFQKMLVRQHDAGVLLCLCTKNNPTDIEAVFEARKEMPLRLEHFVASRINWEAKSSNLQLLAAELDLGVESFVFVDDNPVECAEVRGKSPAVLTLQFPQSEAEILHFIDHVWVFDRLEMTEEARSRNEKYRQNRLRQKALNEAEDFHRFLASLELQVTVEPMRLEQLARVAELIQRTNQFNMTGIRRRSSEIEELWSSGELQIRTVHVRDRFGDYGLVGAVFCHSETASLDVDTFVLSCRVLGRGVERRIVNELGQIASAHGKASVKLSFRRGARNAPAWNFLEKSFGQFRGSAEGGLDIAADIVFTIPADFAATFNNTETAAQLQSESEPSSETNNQAKNVRSAEWHHRAYQLTEVAEILREMGETDQGCLHDVTDCVEPRTDLETAVAQIWSQVIDVENISVVSDFFEIGGDSLSAVQVIARIESSLGLEISLFEFLEGATIEKVAARLSEATTSSAAVTSRNTASDVSLSPAQKRIWFIHELEGGSAAYHIPMAIRIKGQLDHGALRAALDGLVRKHEILRTAIVLIDGEPMQRVGADNTFSLAVKDMRRDGTHACETAVLRQSNYELATPFDLGKGSLVRGTLLQLSNDEHILFITMHHIVSDGWSIGIFFREFEALYKAFLTSTTDPLQPLPMQYADYTHWQSEWLSGSKLLEQLDYWKEQLLGAPELLELPTDRPRPAVQSYRGANASVTLQADLTEDLRSFSRKNKLTLAMVLYAAWSIVLSRVSGQGDIVIGMPVANRRRAEFEGIMGLFVNTLAVRVRLDDDPKAGDFLDRVKAVMQSAYTNQDAPFERVVEALQPARTLSYSPIFQAMFVLQNTPRDEIQIPGLTFEIRDVAMATSKFDLTLSLEESGERIGGFVNYATDLFDAPTIERLIGCLSVVLRGLMDEPEIAVSRLPILREFQRRQLIELFNSTESQYPREKLIHELFEEQVARVPDAIAVTHENMSITYGVLNSRANQLAHYLKRYAVGPGQRVAICLERGVDLLVAVLGVLKVGGAYVPIDPANPKERLRHLLADSSPTLLLTQQSLRKDFESSAVEILTLDGDWAEIARESQHNLPALSQGLTSSDLAYVIYTSGSTGKPKGVMVEHRNVVNYTYDVMSRFNVAAGSGSLVCTSFSFDLVLTGLYPTLACGRTVRLCREEYGMPAIAQELLQSTNLAPLKLTPSHLALLDGPLQRGELAGRVRALVLGGEALRSNAIELWRTYAPDTKIFNHYGPTETTIGCVVNEVIGETQGAIPIGRPISNTQVYILDRHMEPVPIGVIGEIYIGGAGVARGYWKRPELTAERFVSDPFSDQPGARLYRTGDLGRWRTDRTIEYRGRNDDQIKIRGYRVELGDIEAQLIRYPGVAQAAVVSREIAPNDKCLVAYVAAAKSSAGESRISSELLRQYLRAQLPEYMLPREIVILDSIPLTENGKVDRRSLPTVELGEERRDYEAPVGAIEQVIAVIWQELLRIERVSRNDNFFELGGHSLLIVQMLERLRRAGLATELRAVFEHPTLIGLAEVVSRGTGGGGIEVPPNLIPDRCEQITPPMLALLEMTPEHIDIVVKQVPGGARNVQDIYPLAPLQEGILFHYLMNDAGSDTYLVPMVLSASSRTRLDDLVSALQSVIDRHDILRTAVIWEGLPTPVQVVYRKASLVVEELPPGGSRTEQELLAWLQSERPRLDIRQAPLVRLQIVAGLDDQWHALLQTHHLTTDHVTLEVAIAEIVAHMEGLADELPAPVPYRNHVAHSLRSLRERDAETFFKHKLGDVDEPTAPFGILNVRGDGTDVEQACDEIPAQLAARIRAQARKHAVSSATVFHAAWALVVARTSGRDDVVFGSVLLGRLQGSAGSQQTLGMFINTLPLRVKLRDVTAAKLISHVQAELMELFDHEHASLAIAQRCSGVLGASPLFTTLFNYRHGTSDPAEHWSRAKGIKVLTVHGRTNYPITVSVDDLGKDFKLVVQAAPEVDARRLTGFLCSALEWLTAALEESSTTAIMELSLLPEGERRLIDSFNATNQYRHDKKHIHVLVERQVERNRDTPAVIQGSRSLTYRDLNGKANQLARYLRARGVGPGKRVAVYLERSIEMIVGLLGILKAGSPYVPLDPNYPTERLEYMLKDAAPQIVLTQPELMTSLPASEAETLDLFQVLQGIDSHDDSDLPVMDNRAADEDLLYVIYTSGSTGRPKGTAMSHGAMANLMGWHQRCLELQPGQRVLQFAALSFDVAFQEIFSTLCGGGTLILLDEWVRRDARALIDLLSDQRVERIFLPPLMLHNIAEYRLTKPQSSLGFKEVITAGEQLHINEQVVRFFRSLDGCRLHNHYGPTETHVVTALTLSGSPELWPAAPTIGKPIDNTRIHILDSRLKAVPVGVSGEIYIGGANVAEGYLNRPELTRERFLPDPFATDPRARLYKTGDVGRWLADGTIEYLGRNDDQVKIRGYRVELREVETQLMRHPSVKDAAVLMREDRPGEKRLVGYVSRAGAHPTRPDELRAYLKNLLPDYMVPSAFVTLDELPVTPNGKLNRRQLAPPVTGDYASVQYEPPVGDVEEAIAKVWQKLLRLERVGRQDDFFELGGHSLMVLKGLFEIKENLGCALRVIDIYRSPTVEALARRIQEGAPEDDLIDLAGEARLLQPIEIGSGRRCVPARSIMITGATGFVGRFLLAQLVRDTDATLHCLVRARSLEQALFRLRHHLSKWQLWNDDLEQRVVVWPSDLRMSRLGLDEAAYERLCSEVDEIYHCATSMNHLETYAAAKAANVMGVRELVELAAHGKPKLINYVSTLGVFGASADDGPRTIVESSRIDDEKHSTASGYLASKWVAEKILMNAVEAGIPCNIFRLGLVWADMECGRFDELQNVHRVLKSSLLSGYGIASYRYPVAPIPVDYVARAIVCLAGRHLNGGGVFHISAADSTVDGVFERCNDILEGSLELLSYYEWICAIKQRHLEGMSLPAVPLIEFAFSMDKEAFERHQRARRSTVHVRFDCSRTHQELEAAGLFVPSLNGEMLRLCLDRMLSEDEELSQLTKTRKGQLIHSADSWTHEASVKCLPEASRA